MNTRFLFAAAAIVSLIGCDRPPSEDPQASRQREDRRIADEERIAELKQLEDRAAAREAEEQVAQTDEERRALAAERKAIEREKVKLAETQRKVDQQRSAEERAEAQRRAAENAVADRASKQQAKAEQTIDFFHEALDPLGDWLEVEKYGYCWLPRESKDPGWRPYLDGNWAWTDYGWTWTSNEPFGWATYHYGRWTRVRRLGWVWVPGSEWAPAWVAWRRSDRYIGWAPLPPEAYSASGFTAAVDSYYDIGPATYTFVDVESFGESTYVGRVVEPAQNVTVINQTVNVTNVTYKTVENKTVIYNAGPKISEIRPRTKIRELKVERMNETPRVAPPAQQGGVLQVRAPQVTPAPKAERAPTRVRERVKATEVERGWSEGDRASNEKLRARQKDEAKDAEKTQMEEVPIAIAPKPERVPPQVSARAQSQPVEEPVKLPRQEKVKMPAAAAAELAPAPASATPSPVGAAQERPKKKQIVTDDIAPVAKDQKVGEATPAAQEPPAAPLVQPPVEDAPAATTLATETAEPKAELSGRERRRVRVIEAADEGREGRRSIRRKAKEDSTASESAGEAVE